MGDDRSGLSSQSSALSSASLDLGMVIVSEMRSLASGQ